MIRVLSRVALAGAAMVSVPASAAILIFDLSNAGQVINSQTREFTATKNGDTVKVRASAWTLRDGVTLQAAWLRTYDKGLGVEFSGDSNHTVDNVGSFDFITFQFDEIVELRSANLWPFSTVNGTDNDSTVSVKTTTTPFTTTLGLAEVASLDATDYNLNGNMVSPYTVLLNPDGKVGNLWAIGAQFTTHDRDDGFKIDVLKINTLPPVPEPETWAMMLAGFGMVGAALRRRKREPAFA